MVQCKHSYRSRDVFTNLYTRYEREGRAVRRILPSIIIDAICEAQRDQGVPYICFKDHANRQTNQRNIGTLQSSNLCTEIFEWHDKDEYACCSLASINLKSYVLKAAAEDVLARFDFARMHKNVKLVVRGLDRIITSNQYPVPECRKNANKYRPIGIGVQGLANVFMELRIPFLSPEAERLDLEIFETLYHAALEATCELAEELGPYEGFEGSPASEGLLRMDLWLQNQLRLREYSTGVIETMAGYGFCANSASTDSASTDSASTDSASTDMSAPDPTYRGSRILSGRYNWDSLRDRASRGMRNSLLVAPMPTVTTSILLGNYESFEPMPMNIYTSSRSVGKVTECCEYMVKHLIELGLWNDAMKNRIIANDGKLSGIESIPAEVRNIYMTVWEMKQTAIMRRAALRHVFVDQGQSLNIHLPDNSSRYLRGVLNVGWELGNNTGSYYIRTPPASDPLKNNIAEVRAQEAPAQQWNVISSDGPVCTPGCDSCGS
jgi:ribonucleoside-diphosphate reductase alpha subunit